MTSTTMRRIAEELGASVTTVSKVLDDHTDMGPDTRARVLAKIDGLGYRSALRPSGIVARPEGPFHRIIVPPRLVVRASTVA